MNVSATTSPTVFAGLILDSVVKGRPEIKRLAYLSQPPFPGDKG